MTYKSYKDSEAYKRLEHRVSVREKDLIIWPWCKPTPEKDQTNVQVNSRSQSY